MANAHNGNTIFIDQNVSATSIGPTNNVKVAYIVVTPSGASPSLLLLDGTTSKIDLPLIASTIPQQFDFSEAPIYFPNGIKVTSNNIKATLVLKQGTGGQGG